MKVSLLTTCFNDTLAPAVPQAVVAVLERLGHTVDVPREQTCCGQMHLNSGYADAAAPLARRLASVFTGAEAVVTPSASCAGAIRHLFPTHLGISGPPVHEFSEFLVDVLGVTAVGARYRARAVYHPTCHSLRVLRVGDRPLRLLREVAELELLDLVGDDSCCGFGGTFAMKNAAVSGAMLADKMAAITSAGADTVVSLDSSCLMHIGGGFAKGGRGVRAVHLAEVLAGT